jgi:hypothetical protein
MQQPNSLPHDVHGHWVAQAGDAKYAAQWPGGTQISSTAHGGPAQPPQ